MLAFVLPLAMAASADANCEKTDSRGLSFPVCFDPGNALQLGAGVLQRNSPAVLRPTALVTGELRFRTERESKSKEGSSWFNLHRFLLTGVQPLPEQKGLFLGAYQGTYRRHVPEGFILVPTTPPARIPFPFDIAIQMDALGYERRVWEGRGFTLDVARAALLLDPIRSVDGHTRLSFGPALEYVIRDSGTALEHELTPFSALRTDFGVESDDGWWSAHASGVGGYSLVPGGEGRWRGHGEVGIERILVALDDQPIYATVVATGAFADAGVAKRSEWTLQAGLLVRPWSHR